MLINIFPITVPEAIVGGSLFLSIFIVDNGKRWYNKIKNRFL
jgi:hypothetical protein